MSILANPLRLIFFFYLFYLYYSYVRPVPVDSTVREVANLITDYGIHFISFFILGAIAQLANNKNTCDQSQANAKYKIIGFIVSQLCQGAKYEK